MRETIEALRAQRAEELRKLRPLLTTRANRSESAAVAAAWVKTAAAAGADTLRDALANVGATGSISGRALGLTVPGHVLSTLGLDLAPILIALVGPDRVVKVLTAHLDGIADGPDAAEREARIAELRGRLVRLETLEEACVLESERTDAPILRRADADPAVVLMPPEAFAAAYAAAVEAEAAS